MISCLGWGRTEYEEEAAQVLLLKKPSLLETGRIMLYVCPECGDIGCGAITAQIEENAEYVVWHSFGYENDYDPSVLDLAEYQEFGPYMFSKSEYLNTLNHRLSMLAP